MAIMVKLQTDILFIDEEIEILHGHIKGFMIFLNSNLDHLVRESFTLSWQVHILIYLLHTIMN